MILKFSSWKLVGKSVMFEGLLFATDLVKP